MWIRVCAAAEIPLNSAREFIVGDRIVALFHVAGRFSALDGLCPHQGGPLGKGSLSGDVVTCPWHGFQFNVCTGQHQANAAMRQPTLAVRQEGEDLFVEIDGTSPS